MRHLVTASLLLVALIHLIPAIGMIGAARLSALYGLEFNEPNLLILMRHRAVLFALLGSYLGIASFRPAWQGGALLVGLVSVCSFMFLAWSTGGYNAALTRVVAVDVVALFALLIGAVALTLTSRKHRAAEPLR